MFAINWSNIDGIWLFYDTVGNFYPFVEDVMTTSGGDEITVYIQLTFSLAVQKGKSIIYGQDDFDKFGHVNNCRLIFLKFDGDNSTG